MTNEVKALILSFVKELKVRKIATSSDFNYVCQCLNFTSKDNHERKESQISQKNDSVINENFLR